jgi:hypothetical protein
VVPTMVEDCLPECVGAVEEDICTGPEPWYMKTSKQCGNKRLMRDGTIRKGQDGRVRPGCS